MKYMQIIPVIIIPLLDLTLSQEGNQRKAAGGQEQKNLYIVQPGKAHNGQIRKSLKNNIHIGNGMIINIDLTMTRLGEGHYYNIK